MERKVKFFALLPSAEKAASEISKELNVIVENFGVAGGINVSKYQPYQAGDRYVLIAENPEVDKDFKAVLCEEGCFIRQEFMRGDKCEYIDPTYNEFWPTLKQALEADLELISESRKNAKSAIEEWNKALEKYDESEEKIKSYLKNL